MGFSVDVSVPALTVFFQGLLSFFSPCVLPLLPLYIGYLSGGTGKRDESGRMHYDRKKVMIHTLFFVIGVSFAFFVLGFGVSALGTFFKGNQLLFARIGGLLVIAIGLYQFGVFGTSKALASEHRLPVRLNVLAMSPVTALILGFTFSFAWTPCVGPALASVLLMAASAASKASGFLLIGVYTLGFVLPFLAVGLFTTSLLEFFKKHGNVVKYTVKAGAALMILMGFLMFTGRMNAVTGYLSSISLPDSSKNQETAGAEAEESVGEDSVEEESVQPESTGAEESGENAKEEEAEKPVSNIPPEFDFTLKDQYGNTHTLSEYAGKTVLLNFWASWCGPCEREMPDLQTVYEEYQEAGDDSVVILGIAAPGYLGEPSAEKIAEIIEERGCTYPTVMDEGGEFFMKYQVFSYPTTFMIDKEGNFFGYAVGQLDQATIRSIIRQTVEGRIDNAQ